jgi:hypothetical protein
MGGRGIAFETVKCVGRVHGDVMDGCDLLRRQLLVMLVFEGWHFRSTWGCVWIFVICPLSQGVGESRIYTIHTLSPHVLNTTITG